MLDLGAVPACPSGLRCALLFVVDEVAEDPVGGDRWPPKAAR